MRLEGVDDTLASREPLSAPEVSPAATVLELHVVLAGWPQVRSEAALRVNRQVVTDLAEGETRQGLIGLVARPVEAGVTQPKACLGLNRRLVPTTRVTDKRLATPHVAGPIHEAETGVLAKPVYSNPFRDCAGAVNVPPALAPAWPLESEKSACDDG